ncbi:multicomponent Na+:H+ antiporter subunit G [Geomicrobium halophilum]|uniref:Multicomponent Na+:H+ antiporter subunit G n=1 Tax=Geomicrobium halophilum TaxID=549000 RepID=A0A841PWR4_9BACL|nr:monovalent cation/H(+) antiporter subunit G [Geomicrobium halophilum]MBB6448793.1 multicomponent Na+:H+ antiporter subunit G [Geomicrobium halophilum]
MTEILISILVLIGSFLSLIGSLGIIRLPDIYSRMHAATKSATLGVVFLISGSFVFFLSEGVFILQLLFTIAFVFLTAPVAAMIISRSAHRNGVELWGRTKHDELMESYPEHLEPERDNEKADQP